MSYQLPSLSSVKMSTYCVDEVRGTGSDRYGSAHRMAAYCKLADPELVRDRLHELDHAIRDRLHELDHAILGVWSPKGTAARQSVARYTHRS